MGELWGRKTKNNRNQAQKEMTGWFPHHSPSLLFTCERYNCLPLWEVITIATQLSQNKFTLHFVIMLVQYLQTLYQSLLSLTGCCFRRQRRCWLRRWSFATTRLCPSQITNYSPQYSFSQKTFCLLFLSSAVYRLHCSYLLKKILPVSLC